MDKQRRASFYETLSAAIRDISEHGFDHAGRLEYWTSELRKAAYRTMTPLWKMEDMLRSALGVIYTKLVEKGGVAKYHPGMDRFTVQRLGPQLRSELDRRIMASADLIKLNREQAIAKTLQRFSGWSTSIPAGGSSATDKDEAKQQVRKALAGLPFVERRVLIDQGHKLTAAIHDIVATDGGAIALVWHSHWRQAGYDYREDHKERDGQVYAIRGSWSARAGLSKPGDAGYYDNITSVGEEVYCRCYATYLYNLRELPEEMLTARGKAELERVAAPKQTAPAPIHAQP